VSGHTSLDVRICPRCGHGEAGVVDSRHTARFGAIRRRRSCPACNNRWTTLEIAESTIDDMISVARANWSSELEKTALVAIRLKEAASHKGPPYDEH
jgi:transcriptional regulator NrdR family protein